MRRQGCIFVKSTRACEQTEIQIHDSLNQITFKNGRSDKKMTVTSSSTSKKKNPYYAIWVYIMNFDRDDEWDNWYRYVNQKKKWESLRGRDIYVRGHFERMVEIPDRVVFERYEQILR